MCFGIIPERSFARRRHFYLFFVFTLEYELVNRTTGLQAIPAGTDEDIPVNRTGSWQIIEFFCRTFFDLFKYLERVCESAGALPAKVSLSETRTNRHSKLLIPSCAF